MIDYLAAEKLIMQKLSASITEVKILSTAELASVSERSQVTPAIHVIYAGDKIDDEGGQMRSYVFIRQRWLTVLAIRNIRNITDGSTINSTAGELLLQIHNILSGFKLSDDHSFLRREPGPTPQYSNNFAYFPLMFSTKIELQGSLI